MTKSDLRTGMIVKLREGTEFVVFKNAVVNLCEIIFEPQEDIIVNSNIGQWHYLSSYNSNLTFVANSYDDCDCARFDIMEIYMSKDPLSLMNLSIRRNEWKLLWKREDSVKEITMKDIEEKFGCKVKIVREDRASDRDHI